MVFNFRLLFNNKSSQISPFKYDFLSIMEKIAGCSCENQVKSKLFPLDKSVFGGFASSGILAKWSRIVFLRRISSILMEIRE